MHNIDKDRARNILMKIQRRNSFVIDRRLMWPSAMNCCYLLECNERVRLRSGPSKRKREEKNDGAENTCTKEARGMSTGGGVGGNWEKQIITGVQERIRRRRLEYAEWQEWRGRRKTIDPAGNRTQFALVGGERISRCAAASNDWFVYDEVDSELENKSYTVGKIISQKQSSDTHKTPYDRVKWCRERKINIKAFERVNVDVFTQTNAAVDILRDEDGTTLTKCHKGLVCNRHTVIRTDKWNKATIISNSRCFPREVLIQDQQKVDIDVLSFPPFNHQAMRSIVLLRLVPVSFSLQQDNRVVGILVEFGPVQLRDVGNQACKETSNESYTARCGATLAALWGQQPMNWDSSIHRTEEVRLPGWLTGLYNLGRVVNATVVRRPFSGCSRLTSTYVPPLFHLYFILSSLALQTSKLNSYSAPTYPELLSAFEVEERACNRDDTDTGMKCPIGVTPKALN
ncbi:hypothetical protein PR048_001580 [Dryococelus australis]|uniref:GAF domain-containing protein n=1 Tax=Dryococelus australis TaxID=614101 RepID=A0ABQ9IHR5_9NEOP|nr:hypothetical protein PR048_001580 [Dryococelus australis]